MYARHAPPASRPAQCGDEIETRVYSSCSSVSTANHGRPAARYARSNGHCGGRGADEAGGRGDGGGWVVAIASSASASVK